MPYKMEVSRKEDHLQIYVEKRYFIIKQHIKIKNFSLPNLYSIIYDKLMNNDYTYTIYNHCLELKMVLTNHTKSIHATIICNEIFPYSNIDINEETSREDLLKCIQCLKNKLEFTIDEKDTLKNELQFIEDKEYADMIYGKND